MLGWIARECVESKVAKLSKSGRVGDNPIFVKDGSNFVVGATVEVEVIVTDVTATFGLSVNGKAKDLGGGFGTRLLQSDIEDSSVAAPLEEEQRQHRSRYPPSSHHRRPEQQRTQRAHRRKMQGKKLAIRVQQDHHH